jgi:hypothetical protein
LGDSGTSPASIQNVNKPQERRKKALKKYLQVALCEIHFEILPSKSKQNLNT